MESVFFWIIIGIGIGVAITVGLVVFNASDGVIELGTGERFVRVDVEPVEDELLIAYNDCKAIKASELHTLLNELGLDDYECKYEGVGCSWDCERVEYCEEFVRRRC